MVLPFDWPRAEVLGICKNYSCCGNPNHQIISSHGSSKKGGKISKF